MITKDVWETRNKELTDKKKRSTKRKNITKRLMS